LGIYVWDELITGAIKEDEDLFDVEARWEVGRLGDLAGDRQYWRFRSGRHSFILEIEMGNS
jgi:hypothetical protein